MLYVLHALREIAREEEFGTMLIGSDASLTRQSAGLPKISTLVHDITPGSASQRTVVHQIFQIPASAARIPKRVFDLQMLLRLS